MNQKELIERVARRTGEPASYVRKIVMAVNREMVRAVAGGEEVDLKGYLRFKLHEEPQRRWVDPQGRNKWTPAQTRVRAHAGTYIKRAAGQYCRDQREEV